MRVLVTGASGLIGSHLVGELRGDGHEVRRLVRRAAASPDEDSWDGHHLEPRLVAAADAVVHLAGAGVGDRRWTPAYREVIRSSRVAGTGAVAAALAAVAGDGRRRVLLSGSAVGYYGDTGDRLADESSPAGAGFLAGVCEEWERAAQPATQAGVRVVLLRTGIVLAREGGALAKQLPLFRAGLGAPLGPGRQWLSWISLRDEVRAVAHCLASDLSGPVNLVAPAPVTNAEFTRALGRAVHRPTLPVGVPGPLLTAALGGFAREGLLAGQRLAPRALQADGFTFTDPELRQALESVLG